MSKTQFSELLEQAERRRAGKGNKSGKKKSNIALMPQVTVNIPEKEIDFNKECGCYGTEHPAINNCMNCGRVICRAEGERPCPYCGTPVFSDETLENPDKMEYLAAQFQALATKTGWVPICDRDLKKSVAAPHTETKIYDLETDWFSNEIAKIYGLEEEEEEEEEEVNQGPVFSDYEEDAE
ncbi:Zinc finger motif, C2HC5-type family protein [Trichomonas vaginalis G3]|uniref:Zinc finger motif, C2HC5-type family protein n=1 Tax=Trichomonas vaginalis (strain ATCC PRA-98 / G3) TaxID=412133 RepID=A2ECM5_TRIV3|nr:transcription coactivator protein [Trichomonas vaginalis G3]EAY09622.1 Zinc finger motif, C2HC5-type family protein [Trichomonas vaginalis G3]KAI5502133.1 transcription coactivator protein [Trichomonas vaginalis G3]|eukprot:XP_001321845.1 Zinc finger motif, C2HC5-type family protein [Trichomonas vaginalis G3]